MMSYRFARRSFLASIGGAFGIEILLNNMEAGAMGAGPPPRFLMMHWPSGTIRTQFVPMGTGMSYVTSPAAEGGTGATNNGAGYIISPFDTPELRPETIILYGFNMSGISSGQGGGHESGTPMATTGANCPGTRDNQGEDDDGCAGGPSWDQIMLKNVPALARRNPDGTVIGKGYYNSICDSRIDSYETSTRCLSYSHERQQIQSARPGGMITENKPLEPTLSPLTAFNDLFSGFVPGGGMTDEAALRLLKHRRSVLDYSRRELTRLRTLGPSSEWGKIDAHAEAIRKIEDELTARINMGGTTGGMCTPPMAPAASLTGKSGSKFDYNNPVASTSDEMIHEQVGQAHAGIIRAAFQCDLIRVATFQWSPGTNHVSFKGLDPNSPNTIYMHHPLSHRVQIAGFFDEARPSSNTNVWDAMVNANRWYFQKTADIINQFRTAVDPLDPAGGSLLNRTVIPMVTEVAEANHGRNGHGAIIFGGKALGMQGGQFRMVSGTHNQFWVTVAQAYLGANAVSELADETYVKNGANPISGLWVQPA
jgi:hypothetical protein